MAYTRAILRLTHATLLGKLGLEGVKVLSVSQPDVYGEFDILLEGEIEGIEFPFLGSSYLRIAYDYPGLKRTKGV